METREKLRLSPRSSRFRNSARRFSEEATDEAPDSTDRVPDFQSLVNLGAIYSQTLI